MIESIAGLVVLAAVLVVAVVLWLRNRGDPTLANTLASAIRSADHHALVRRELELSRNGGHIAVVADREQRWPRRMATVKVGLNLRAWADDMAKRHGNPRCRVGFQRVDWLTALMVVRYGESEDYWPAAFTKADEERAVRWQAGEVPRRVTYLPPIERAGT
jgi:hypothetical protein